MRPTVVMLAGLGLLYLLYTGRAEAVLSALSSGGSGGGWSGGGSGTGGGGGGGGAEGGGGFNGSNDAADTTAPVKGYKGKPNSEKCPSGYKWDHTRNTCVKQ